MTYRVSTNPFGERRWWCKDEEIPADHTDIGPASPAVVALADRILAHDRAGRMPPAGLGDKMAALLAS